MLRLANELDICGAVINKLRVRRTLTRTSILDAALRKDTVAPVRDAADHLHAARPASDRLFAIVVLHLRTVEAVTEALANAEPVLAVWVS